jgi:hypothetical protein
MDKQEKKQNFVTERRIVSYTTSVSAMSRPEVVDDDDDIDDDKPVLVSEFISPWNLALPNMSFGRHSHGIATVGKSVVSRRISQRMNVKIMNVVFSVCNCV